MEFIWKHRDLEYPEDNYVKKNKVEDIILSDFQAYFVATIIKTMWYLWGYKHMYQWNKREDTEIELYKYTELIFDREAKPI